MTEKFGNDFQTTIVGGINNSSDPVVITLANTPPSSLATGDWRARIDSEVFLITSVSGNDVTASRAQEITFGGGAIATHLTGAVFNHVLTAGSITKIPEYPLLASANTYQGSISLPTTTQTGDYSVGDSDWLVLANAASNAITITLPTAIGKPGRQYVIKKFDSTSTTYRVTVATTSSQTIDGETTQVITDNYTAITVISNGANWVII